MIDGIFGIYWLTDNVEPNKLEDQIKCADLNMYTTLFSHIFDKFLKLKLI